MISEESKCIESDQEKLGEGPCTGPLAVLSCLTWDVLESSEIPPERKEHKTMKTKAETKRTALEK
jgi:hypothetical protein